MTPETIFVLAIVVFIGWLLHVCAKDYYDQKNKDNNNGHKDWR